jgi:hypothetical protein
MMTDRLIPPHKARRLLMVAIVCAVHIVVLLIWWPRSWPSSYKWLLLPDALGLYALIAVAVENMKPKVNLTKEETGQNG